MYIYARIFDILRLSELSLGLETVTDNTSQTSTLKTLVDRLRRMENEAPALWISRVQECTLHVKHVKDRSTM